MCATVSWGAHESFMHPIFVLKNGCDKIRHDSNPATVTPLLCWLLTKHNLIDLAKKAFPASESKNISKKVKTRNLKLQI
jgi:hypothetical protein